MANQLVLDYPSKYKKQAARFQLKEYLCLGGGPSNCSERVLKALSMQCLYPVLWDVFKVLSEVKELIKYVFQTENPLTLMSQTSGNGGNETILLNLMDPGDKLVIAIGGVWGEIVLNMAQRHNLEVFPLRKPLGEIFTIDELEDAVGKYQAKMLFVTHGETTGTIRQKLEGLGAMCHKYDCLLAVDAIASVAVDPLFVDRWEVDAISAGTQKAVGAPPGMCLLTFSPRAEKIMKNKKTQPPYYMDVLKLANYWNNYPTYHYTFSSNMMAAVREALAQIHEEGLVEMWERHRRNTRYFWKRLEEIGLECVVEKEENRFHGVTGVKIPRGVNEAGLLQFLREKYAIDITPGYGPTSGRAMRVGLMGQNSRPEVVDYLIEAIQDGVKQLQIK